MIPLVLDKKELQILDGRDASSGATKSLQESRVKLEYLVGTMIELPRAALLADEIAEVAEFFSFGTNDLTQTVMGLSRDDAGRFLPDYVDEEKTGIFHGRSVPNAGYPGRRTVDSLGHRTGRATRPKLKIGICGEHGGDGASVKFCHQVGMDYVSASPFRVPIARLAAAQAVIEERAAKRRQEENEEAVERLRELTRLPRSTKVGSPTSGPRRFCDPPGEIVAKGSSSGFAEARAPEDDGHRAIISRYRRKRLVLQQDHYYRDLPDLPVEERARQNFDHPDSLDTPLLIEHICATPAGHRR